MFQKDQTKTIKTSTFFTACLMLGLVSCKSGGQQGPPPGVGAGPQEYAVFTVVSRKTTLFQEYPATIQGQQDIDIRPKIDGYVENILVDEGSKVYKGQTLFTIRNPQYQQDLLSAEAAVNSANADLSQADLAVRKARPLVEREIISKYELESAEYTLQARKASLKQAKASLENAKVNLGYTTVSSPVDGIVGTIPYRNGSYINSTSTQPLTTVSNTGNVFVYFSLNEKEYLNITRQLVGNTMSEKLANMPNVELLLADGTVYSFPGKVETMSGQISKETGSASLRAVFPNKQALIRSGGTGKIKIPQTLENAILIPQKCTYEIQGKRFLYVAEKSGTVRSREVEVLNSTSGPFFIVKNGLEVGDQVVLEGVQSLKDKMSIKAKPLSESQVYDVES